MKKIIWHPLIWFFGTFAAFNALAYWSMLWVWTVQPLFGVGIIIAGYYIAIQAGMFAADKYDNGK